MAKKASGGNAANAIPESARLPASDYIIIGGTGDLSLRKIFPALFERFLAGQVTHDFRLIVAARRDITSGDFAAKFREFCHSDDAKAFAEFTRLIHVHKLDVSSGEGGDALAALLDEKKDAGRPRIFYLAIAPSLIAPACRMLEAANLVDDTARLVVEKPLGHDGESAAMINDELRAVFDEANIYRIDHYLGKETVQNLMALRFANTIFENQWDHNFIDHIQITVAEAIGVEDRAGYYDNYGALRDMIQNHLLQLVCLVAMEPPAQFTADQVRDEKLRVLRALKPVPENAMAEHLVTGQYDGYCDELGKKSNTETFVALKLFIANWRWSGVPFYLRTGKRLANRASEIIITFKQSNHHIFGDASSPNRLVIRLQPDEGLRLGMTAKQPGPGGIRLFDSELELDFGEHFTQRMPDAYERLLMDVARGNQTLFMRHDEVMAAWQFMDPLIDAAAKTKPETYAPGSAGPTAQDRLFTPGDGDSDDNGWIAPAPPDDD